MAGVAGLLGQALVETGGQGFRLPVGQADQPPRLADQGVHQLRKYSAVSSKKHSMGAVGGLGLTRMAKAEVLVAAAEPQIVPLVGLVASAAVAVTEFLPAAQGVYRAVVAAARQQAVPVDFLAAVVAAGRQAGPGGKATAFCFGRRAIDESVD